MYKMVRYLMHVSAEAASHLSKSGMLGIMRRSSSELTFAESI